MFELSLNAHAMRRKDSHAHTGACSKQAWNMQNLAAFIAPLLLLIRLLTTVIHNRPNKRHSVECNCLHNLSRLRECNSRAIEHKLVCSLVKSCLSLINQLQHTITARASNSLVRGCHQTLQSKIIVQYLHRRHSRHRGAVRICNNTAWHIVQIFWINLSHNQRNIIMHTPLRRIVNNVGASFSETRSPYFRGATTSGKNSSINAA